VPLKYPAGASGLIDALYILVDAHRQMATTMQEKPQNAPKPQLRYFLMVLVFIFSWVWLVHILRKPAGQSG
jgi:ADP-glucose pyrophosphorylase